MRFIALMLALSLLATAHAADAPKTVVYFSPNGGCTAAVVDALGKAKKTVLVQAYPSAILKGQRHPPGGCIGYTTTCFHGRRRVDSPMNPPSSA